MTIFMWDTVIVEDSLYFVLKSNFLLQGSAGKGAPYYMGSTASLPRGATFLRTYSPAVSSLSADRMKPLPTGKVNRQNMYIFVACVLNCIFLSF